MILDFSKCKNKEDVDQLFDKNLKNAKALHAVSELIRKCINATRKITEKNKEEDW